jgi:hypothetical protein
MAEETPGNLGSMFGGFMAGRAAGNRRLDASIDRLEESINKFADTLDKSASRMGSATGGSGNGGGSGPTQQSTAQGNGGHPSFGGGSHRGTPSFAGSFFGGQTGGAHAGEPGGARSNGQTSWSPFGSGGAHSSGGSPSTMGQAAGAAYERAGGARGIAAGVGGAAVAATAVYAKNHYASQDMGQSVAAQYAGGPNWSQAYQNSIPGNYSAVNSDDNMRATNILAGQGGMTTGGVNMAGTRSNVLSSSYINPQISNTQAAQSSVGLAQIGTYNRMQGLGLNPMGKGGNVGDPRSLARQILQKIPGVNDVKTKDQVAAMFAPAGSASVTVQNMVASGAMPQESSQVVLSEMRSIMQARTQGMSYKEYNATATAAQSSSGAPGDAARDRLRSVGLGNTLVNRHRTLEGQQRDSEAKTIEGFTDGVTAATNTLGKFRDVLNSILGLPGVGYLAGAGSGAMGTMPILGGLLGKVPGGGMLKGLMSAAGGSAPTMSQGGGGDMSGHGGWGGDEPARQSAKKKAGGSSGASHTGAGSSGLSLAAPRPGINSMSSEQDFGKRTIGQGWHTGVDLEGSKGAPVKAAAAGTIVASGWGASGDGGYGNVIVINHGGGWKTMYAHLSSISKGKGRKVRQGEVIGAVGDTGSYSRGAHLHFEVWKNGKPVDPEPFLRGKKMSGASGKGGAVAQAGGAGSGAAAGTADDPVTASTGQTLGSSGSYANASSGGGGGGGSAGGGFSEVAALGLGSGSSMSGGGSSGGSEPEPDPAVAGGVAGGGIGGIPQGSTRGARVDVASINVYNKTSARQTEADLAKLMKASADVIALQEITGAKRRQGLGSWLSNKGWGLYMGQGDTSIAWDKSKYDAVKKGSWALNPNNAGKAGLQHRYAAYALLRNKQTGTQYWQASVHTIPKMDGAHNTGTRAQRTAIEREQKARLGALYKYLNSTGYPVVISGDIAMAVGKAPPGMKYATGRQGVESTLVGQGANALSAHMMHGFQTDHDHAQMNSISIGGAKNAASNGGGGGGGTRGLHGNKAIVNSVAQKYGWGKGAQWDALVKLVNAESGFRNTAQNPTSTAYGMFQFLNSTWKGYPYPKTSDPRKQAVDGLMYVKNRYKNPIGAWKFHQSHNWYAMGEWNIRDDKDARVHKGEMILPSKVADIVRTELTAPGIRDVLGGGKGGGKGGIVFENGAIQVVLGEGSNLTQREAKVAGERIVDAVANDARMRALMRG